ncbi:hypothetical protein P7K49_027931, partial [Saguinus oedipus]
ASAFSANCAKCQHHCYLLDPQASAFSANAVPSISTTATRSPQRPLPSALSPCKAPAPSLPTPQAHHLISAELEDVHSTVSLTARSAVSPEPCVLELSGEQPQMRSRAYRPTLWAPAPMKLHGPSHSLWSPKAARPKALCTEVGSLLQQSGAPAGPHAQGHSMFASLSTGKGLGQLLLLVHSNNGSVTKAPDTATLRHGSNTGHAGLEEGQKATSSNPHFTESDNARSDTSHTA